MVTVTTNKKFKPEDFFYKTCKLGYDDIVFALEYGYSCEFIGQLKPVDGTDDEYRFTLDKVEKRGSMSFIKTFGTDNDDECSIIVAALRQDYGLEDVIIN